MDRPASENPPAPQEASTSFDTSPGSAGKAERFFRVLLLVLLVVLANVFMNGLTFGHGDHYSHIPALKHFMEPAHLADDWYIQTLDNLNVRHFMVAVLAPMARCIGVPATFLLLQVVVLGMMAWGLMIIGRYFFGDPAGWWAALAVMLACVGEGIGFVTLWAYIVRAPDVASAFALLAVAFWLERRFLLSGICLGLTLDFHPLVGAQVSVMLGVVHLLSRRREWRSLALVVISSAVVGAPAMWLYLMRGASGDVDRAMLMDTHYFRVLGRADPLRWTPETWVSLLALVIAGTAAIRELRRRIPPERRSEARWIFVLPCAVFLLAIPMGIFLEQTAMVQPLRVAIWPRVIIWCLLGAWCARRWAEGGVRRFLAFAGMASVLNEWVLVGVWTLVLLASADWKPGETLRAGLLKLEKGLLAVLRGGPAEAGKAEASRDFNRGWRTFLVVTALVIVATAAPHWAKARPAFKSSVPAFSLYMLAATMLAIGLRVDLRRIRHLVLCALALVLFQTLRLPGAPLGPKPGRWAHIQFWLTPTNEEEVVAAWCGANLPEGVRLIVPPHAETFRLFAGRPVVVSYKCFPFSSPDVLEWRRRMLEVCGMPYNVRLRYRNMGQLIRSYNHQLPEKILKVGRDYDATIFLTRSPWAYPFPQLYSYGLWKVYRLPIGPAGEKKRKLPRAERAKTTRSGSTDG